MNIALWIVQILLAAMYGMSGSMKTFQTAKAKEQFPWAKNRSDGYVRFIGISELLGVLGLVLPIITGILPWLTPLAGAGLALVMVLAIGFHASRREAQAIGFNAVLLVLAAFVAYGRFMVVPL